MRKVPWIGRFAFWTEELVVEWKGWLGKGKAVEREQRWKVEGSVDLRFGVRSRLWKVSVSLGEGNKGGRGKVRTCCGLIS